MARLSGKKVVVIGGASGVGHAVGAAALAAGAEVVVGSSQAARIAAAAERLGHGTVGRTVDVRDEASVAAFLCLILAHLLCPAMMVLSCSS